MFPIDGCLFLPQEKLLFPALTVPFVPPNLQHTH